MTQKLTRETVDEMRVLHYGAGLCFKCVAKLHNQNYFTARAAITGDSWGPISEWHAKAMRHADVVTDKQIMDLMNKLTGSMIDDVPTIRAWASQIIDLHKVVQ